MEKLREIFLKNIVSEAKRQKLKYKDVADRAGLSRSGIYKIMQGQREPGFDNIDRIAKALGISPHSLLMDPATQSNEPASLAEAWEIVGKALQAFERDSMDLKVSPLHVGG